MLLLILAVLVSVVVGLLVYARWNYGSLEKRGIPVVPHHPILGCTRIHYSTAGGLEDTKWLKKYGPIFGVYEGREAQTFICVPELVRLICVKDSSYFDSKRRLDFSDPVMNEMPDFQPLEKWKLLRSLATPIFTSAKVKMMNLPMKEATQDFVSGLKKQIKSSGKGVYEKLAIDSAIHTMLTDLIARCVFSIRVNDNQDGNNGMAKLVKDLMVPPEESALQKELVIWSHTFPFIRKFMDSTIFQSEPVKKIVPIFRQMMKERRASGQKCNDIIDMCIEWMDKLDTPEFRRAQISELTIMCQALVFFFATQDQVSMQVSGLIYHMTLDPELEKRVYEEIDAVFAKHDGNIEHEHLHEFVYVNACLNECLRLYPFFHRIERVCTKEWKSEEYNLHFVPGDVIIFPLWAINRNPEYNENPEKFDPERFMPQNKDKLNVYASTSFGHGPRNRTGKRFATEVMPLIAAYILKELRFKKRHDTKLTFVPGGPFFQPHEEIYVDVMER